MTKILNALGLFSAIAAAVLSALPFSNYAFYPAILALIFGITSFFQSKKKSKKVVQLIFVLTILALSLATYRSLFSEVKETTTVRTKNL